MAQIKTVNIVEYADDDLLSIRSFEESPEGNKEAEELFKQCVVESGATEEEVESFIEDGYYEQGTYQIFLSHSA